MGLFSSSGKKKAAAEMQKAQDTMMGQYQEKLGMYKPYKELGDTMVKDFGDYYKSGGYKFDPSTVQIDPGYGFRQQQGQQAIENSAMARGGLMSGNTIKASQQFGQDLASQEYGNAYNRAYQDYSNQLNFRTGMLDWGRKQTDTFADIRGQDPTAQFQMQRAQQLASKSKGLGSIIGNTLMGGLKGGLTGGIPGALGGAAMPLGMGIFGGMF
jgi:hypothetical protein